MESDSPSQFLHLSVTPARSAVPPAVCAVCPSPRALCACAGEAIQADEGALPTLRVWRRFCSVSIAVPTGVEEHFLPPSWLIKLGVLPP